MTIVHVGRRERLSQVCLNRWTVLLLLVLARILFAVEGARSNVTTAHREALRGCTQIESTGSSIASLPNYMAAGVNDLIARGIEHSVNALATRLDMAVTGVEQIVLFVVHMMISTYLCLITFGARGTTKVVEDVTSDMAESLQKSIEEITDSLVEVSTTLRKSLGSLQKMLDEVPLASNWTLPNADFTDQINMLRSLELKSELQHNVGKLDDDVPTFEAAQNFVDDLITTPFAEARRDIQAMGALRLDCSLLPVPQKQQLKLCSDDSSINNFFDDLFLITVQARILALSVLIALAVLPCIIKICIIIGWVNLDRFKQLVTACLSRRSPELNRALLWFFAYVTTIPMLFVLSLGTAGLLACLLQFALAKVIEGAEPRLTRQVVSFAEKTIDSLTQTSLAWSEGVNDTVRKLYEQINNDVIGLVNRTTVAVDNTFDAFVEQTNKELNRTVDGTVLGESVQELIRCLLGLKLASFQEGLGWVREHTYITFPEIKNDTFTLGALSQLDGVDSAADLLADPNGKAGDAITAALHRAVNNLMAGILAETIVAGVLVGVWLLFAVIGAAYVTGCFLVARTRLRPIAHKKVTLTRTA